MLTQLEERALWIAVVLITLISAALLYNHHERQLGAQRCEMDDAQVAAIQAQAARAQEAKDATRIQNAESQYHAEISTPLAPLEPVRLCLQARPSGVPEARGHPAGPPKPSTPGGTLPPVAGADISGRLFADADQADRLSAQLRALQLACQQ